MSSISTSTTLNGRLLTATPGSFTLCSFSATIFSASLSSVRFLRSVTLLAFPAFVLVTPRLPIGRPAVLARSGMHACGCLSIIRPMVCLRFLVSQIKRRHPVNIKLIPQRSILPRVKMFATNPIILKDFVR